MQRGHKHQPARASPGPSALTLDASCEGSTLTRNGLAGISYIVPQKNTQSNSSSRGYLKAIIKELTYLICEKDFDGEASSPWWDVLHCNGVVSIGNDIKIDVFFFIADHVGVTLDTHTDITYSMGKTIQMIQVLKQGIKCHVHAYKCVRVFTFPSFCAVHSEVCGLVSLQASSLHSRTKHFHLVRVTALSNLNLRHSCVQVTFKNKAKINK